MKIEVFIQTLVFKYIIVLFFGCSFLAAYIYYVCATMHCKKLHFTSACKMGRLGRTFEWVILILVTFSFISISVSLLTTSHSPHYKIWIQWKVRFSKVTLFCWVIMVFNLRELQDSEIRGSLMNQISCLIFRIETLKCNCFLCYFFR